MPVAVPEERRGNAIVGSFEFGNEVAVGLQLLVDFPLPKRVASVEKAIPKSDYPTRKAQARLKLSKAYDGRSQAAAERFDAFKGFLEIRDVADKKTKEPAYVVFLDETYTG